MGDIEMLKFEEYWTENASKESCANKSVAWRIWESKQAEIEAKDKRITELEKGCISYKYQRDESNHKLMIKSAQYSSIQEHLAALKDRLDVAYNMATKKTFNPLGQLRKVISSLENKDV